MEQKDFEAQITSYVNEYANGKETTFYKISCKLADQKWVLKKRYKEFHSLHSDLKFSHGNLPSIPGKTLFSLKKPDEIEKRKTGLNSFVQGIVKRPDLYSNASFLQFFKIDKKRPDLHINQMESLGKVTHSFMGYRDIQILPQQRIFFSIVSDMNAISR